MIFVIQKFIQTQFNPFTQLIDRQKATYFSTKTSIGIPKPTIKVSYLGKREEELRVKKKFKIAHKSPMERIASSGGTISSAAAATCEVVNVDSNPRRPGVSDEDVWVETAPITRPPHLLVTRRWRFIFYHSCCLPLLCYQLYALVFENNIPTPTC